MSHAQALIHNDLHTGSIMVNEQDTKVIDPEFAFFGPMGHDIGTYLGNLVFGHVIQDFYAHGRSRKTSYQAWILETIRDTWKIFEQEFRTLWDQNGIDGWQSPAFKDYYLLELLRDSAGFGAAEMFRRIIGMAHVQDFEHIEDEKARAIAESTALTVANNWIMNQSSFTSIDDLISIIQSAEPFQALKE
jgi:5-methylthioribose kinase